MILQWRRAAESMTTQASARRRSTAPAGTEPASTGPAPPPASFAAPWGGQGFLSDLGGPVHWVDFGGPSGSSAPPLVLVHGLGGSHLDWVGIAPALAADRRILALDLAGFGLTPAAGRLATAAASAGLLGRFVREIAGAPAVLVGNSMGGMVSVLAAHADPAAVAGLVLVDAPVPAGGPWAWPDQRLAADLALYATPGAGELYLWSARWRLTPRQQVGRILDLCFADPGRASPDIIEAGVRLAEFRRTVPGTEHAFLQAARSVGCVLAWPGRYRALLDGLDAPVLLLHGEQDRLVPAAAARREAAAHPGWTAAVLPGAGHTPQLEVPGEVVAAIRGWLELAGGPGARAGTEPMR
jgi:pimeloyl-ACP methyl ester carboxylesterase